MLENNVVNDMNRLQRFGNELSGTNQKLIAAVSRTVDSILEIVPADLENSSLGMGYIISGETLSKYFPALFDRGEEQFSIRRGQKDIPLCFAQAFARDVANGFVDNLYRKLGKHLKKTKGGLGAVEDAEILLKK